MAGSEYDGYGGRIKLLDGTADEGIGGECRAGPLAEYGLCETGVEPAYECADAGVFVGGKFVYRDGADAGLDGSTSARLV